MLVSECCKANALFGIAGPHGIYLSDESYTGICSECKEHSEFKEKEKEDNG